MNGFLNCAFEMFLRHNFGDGVWFNIVRAAKLDVEHFEPLSTYDPEIMERVIRVTVEQLSRPREAILEDLGAWLVSAPETESLRRLLRFGGVTFPDFLHSLEELPARARLALPDISLPELHLVDQGADGYALSIDEWFSGAGAIFMGLLRAMADDYGTLAVIESGGTTEKNETVLIKLLDTDYAKGRAFVLADAVP